MKRLESATLGGSPFVLAREVDNRERPVVCSVAMDGCIVSLKHTTYDTEGRVSQLALTNRVDESAHTFVYDGWLPVLETIVDANNITNIVEYFWGPDLSGTEQGAGGIGGLLATSIDGQFYFPTYDHNGNITAYSDATGARVAWYVYDAFGNTITQGGIMADAFSFRFSTKYWDAETGMYYYGHRFYVPWMGRWLNRDPIEEEGGFNIYSVCENRPTVLFDSLGLFFHWYDPKAPLQTLEQIPGIMDANGWYVGARLMRYWFSKKVSETSTPNLTDVKMDWALGFARAQEAYESIFSDRKYATENSLAEISRMVRRKVPSLVGHFGDFETDVQEIDKDYITRVSVGSSATDPVDDLAAALGRFTFRIAVRGNVGKLATKTCVSITDVGVYIYDKYNFIGIQPLGYWNAKTNYGGKNPKLGMLVENKDFEDSRSITGRGVDFDIYSDLKQTHLGIPYCFELK